MVRKYSLRGFQVLTGSGSPPIQKPPISSSFYLDEGHVADIKSNGKEQATSK
jgi:hypothetical protein